MQSYTLRRGRTAPRRCHVVPAGWGRRSETTNDGASSGVRTRRPRDPTAGERTARNERPESGVWSPHRIETFRERRGSGKIPPGAREKETQAGGEKLFLRRFIFARRSNATGRPAADHRTPVKVRGHISSWTLGHKYTSRQRARLVRIEELRRLSEWKQ